ncbi:MAG: F0F1 ATP synthase subunit epsilon [Mycobacteriales bacterium]
MAQPLQVELVAPDRMVWSGEAQMLIARTTDGDIGVLAGHESLLALLVPYPVTIKREGEADLVAAVHGGFLSVTRERVSLLAERVELADEIDVARARQALGAARENAGDPEAAAAIRRAETRLRAAGESL